MIRLLHLADVHLGASLSVFGEYAPDRHEQVLQAFREMPDVIDHEQVDAALVAGDLFDSHRPGSAVVAAATETVRRMAEKVPVFIVPGNHDPILSRRHPYIDIAELAGVELFTAPCFQQPVSVELPSGHQLAVSGLAYDPALSRNPLDNIPPAAPGSIHVVLLHASLRHAPHWSPSPNTLSLDQAQLGRIRADYIAMGDHHRFQAPADIDPSAVTPACYCGSFAAADFTEHGRRGYVIAELSPPAAVKVSHRSCGIPSLLPLDLDITGCDSEAEVIEQIIQEVDEGEIPLVTLTGSPGCPLDSGRVALHLRERCAYAVVKDLSHYCDSLRLEELSRADTITGHVARLGRERIRNSEHDEQRRIAERGLRIALRALEGS